MNTPNETKQQRRAPSHMEFHEKAHWKVSENIVTVVAGEEKKPVAYIKLEKYDEDKKPVLSCHDLDGNQLAEPTSNLYELKKQLKDKEPELTQAMLERTEQQKTPERVEAPAPKQPEQKPQTPEAQKSSDLKKVRSTKADKQKENEQDLSRS